MEPPVVLLVPDYKKDLVYLVQYPRTRMVPTHCPYALKLETWLRMAGIQYENIDNEFKHFGPDGRQPFVELNGGRIYDSNNIIEKLAEHFGGKAKEMETLPTPEDTARAHAFSNLIEHHMTWATFYSRSRKFKWLRKEDGYLLTFETKRQRNFLEERIVEPLEKEYRKKCKGQWVGGLKKQEIVYEMKKDIIALGEFFGRKKKFIMGNELKTLDATLFGHLTELLHTPQFTLDIKMCMEAHAWYVIDYMYRLREVYWPDWHDITSTGSMNLDVWESHRDLYSRQNE